ncbi:hypothetical protein ONZ45_g15698 [Pleurotus djamor]|nr:hypothetical protein ONZ45_g15698 [Pleurotus djamor]
MLNKLIGWNWNFGFMEYGNPWRERRQGFWQEFNPSKSFNHQPVQLKYAREFLKKVLDDPAGYRHHCIYTAASAIIEVIYGFPVQPENDPTITISEKATKHLHNAGITGTYLVDHVPALQYLPLWFPGAGFLRYAKVAYQDTMDMVNIPFNRVRDHVAQGDAPPSLITRGYARDGGVLGDVHKEKIIQDVASVAYAAGVDTTPSPIISFIAAMILFPTVQKKAQEEVDRVLGSTRLPTFEDRLSLPYVQAIVWEVLRWKPVVPLGLPHLLTSDTVHKGSFLPKGSTVFANVWAIMRDEKIFPQAHEFRPERFLTADGEIDAKLAEIVDIGFGFGRRICPGRFFARDTVLIWIASILAVFDISAAKDENGEDIRPDLHMIPSSILTLPPFKCDIKVRSMEAERLARDG